MLFVAIGLAGLAALFLVEERVRGSLGLAAWQRDMRGRGEKLTVGELAPPLPTNSAVRVVSPIEAQGILGAARAPATVPSPMLIVAPGKARLASAAEQWLDSDGRTNTWRDLDAAFEGLRDPLSELRVILTNRTLFIHVDLEQGFETLLPHLASLKSAMQSLNADTAYALHKGRLDQAHENLMAATFLLDLMKDEPLLISQLVRIADAAIIQAGVWEALQADGWTDAQLSALQARWQQQEFMAPMGRALEGERALAAQVYDPKRYSLRKLIETTRSLQSMGFWGGVGESASESELVELFRPVIALGRQIRRVIHLACWRFAWAKQDQLFHHRETQRQIDTARRAASDRRWKATANLAPDEDWQVFAGSGLFGKLGWYNRLRYWLALETLTAWDTALGKAARMEVAREQIVAAIALKRHELRHGHLPPTLDTLVPEFLTSTPHDWFADAAMSYRPIDDKTFVLYSLGPNALDEGGDSRNPKGEVRGLYFGRDTVWPQRASPEEVAAAEWKRDKSGRNTR